MELIKAIQKSFIQLTDALDQLTEQQYTTVSENLSGATIGQHMRHVIELYQCLQNGYNDAVVCYDHRKRDTTIETDKELAKHLLLHILTGVDRNDKDMQLQVYFGEQSSTPINLATNYYRELLYNYEHSVHHMALIRVGLKEFSAGAVTENFGVANSTIRYKNNVHSNIHS